METTASYIATCRMAKLRVGWMVPGWAPGVLTIFTSSLFQSTTIAPDAEPAGAAAEKTEG